MKASLLSPVESRTSSHLTIRVHYIHYVILATLSVFLISRFFETFRNHQHGHWHALEEERGHILARCQSFNVLPGSTLQARSESDRFVPGTKATLLRNGKIWTSALNGTEVVYGDVLLDKGIVKAVGYIPHALLASIGTDQLQVQDVQGAWITPGLVDIHSHIGVGSLPQLQGASDTNSKKAPILPWLRSLDGLNTHDTSYALAVAGGVTSAQILPGSRNNIGGQAFVIKLRSTTERSAISKVIEPPYTLNGTGYDHTLPPRWRHMKHACGENPSRAYAGTRMDSGWSFREAYNEARKIRDAQDAFCAKAEKGFWKDLGEFPESLKWESLVDVLRGRVKVSVHCYEPVDFDMIVRLSNEFKFPVASFHHAGSAYLVPDLIKKTWGGTPAVALFASNFRKKREAYRGSEFGPRILSEERIPVIMKSDHPVVNSRYLLNEAATAFYYGLPANLALSSVTSTPAQAAGLDHRIGSLQPGFDADLVIWDSYPLALGATPKQVYIDGMPQFDNPHVSPKPDAFQVVPKTPNFDKQAKEAVEYEGLPPLAPRQAQAGGGGGGGGGDDVLFTNVKSVWSQVGEEIVESFSVDDAGGGGEVLSSVFVREGKIVCVARQLGASVDCMPRGLSAAAAADGAGVEVIDLEGGMVSPGLTTFGSPIGTVEIRLEPSTNDGTVFDPLRQTIPSVLGGGGDDVVVRAVDGLEFEGRNTLLAFRSGVTMAVTAPSGTGFWKGLSVAFHTGAQNALQDGAILQQVASLHVALGKGDTAASVSTEVAALRHLLLLGKEGSAFTAAAQGEIPLVVEVENADIIATLIRLKAEVESKTGKTMRLTLAGAAEAWRLASEIGKANVGVILSPSRSFPLTWDELRFLAGPPITYDTPLTTLIDNNVTVAIGVRDEFAARNTRFDMAWAALESNGRIGKSQAFKLASTDLERLLGVNVSPSQRHYVAWKGGDVLEMTSQAVAVFSASRGLHLL